MNPKILSTMNLLKFNQPTKADLIWVQDKLHNFED